MAREYCVRNRIRCKVCDTVIESLYNHHFTSCKCGKVSADGGTGRLSCVRRIGNPDDYEDLSEWTTVRT